MLGSWFAKGLVAFLLTFALAGLAHGQTKSADLPVSQRINCAPANGLPIPVANSDVIVTPQYWTQVSWTQWSDSWSDLQAELDGLSGYLSDLILLWRSMSWL